MAKKVVKKVAKKTAKKVTKKVVKKAPKKVVKKAPAKKVAPKKVAKKVTQKLGASFSLKVGQAAPDFSLKDQNGAVVSLKDFKGKKVVVYFYPKAMTPGCTVQACGIRDTQSGLKAENIVVLGVSADAPNKLKQFEEKQKLNFTLLSDPDHKVCEAYGSWGLKKFMGREFMGILRQSFLIDESGKIVHVMSKVDTKTHHQDILKAFKHQ